AIGQPLRHDDKSHWFLCGLGSSFETFSTTQRLITPRPKFCDLVSQSESREMFLHSINDSSVAPVAFNITHRSSTDSSRGCGSTRGRSPYRGSSNRGRGRGTRHPPYCQLYRTKSQCNTSSPDWFVDTGASTHMTPSSTNLDVVSSYEGNDYVIFGNGNGASISHIGRLHISPNISLLDVLVVPNLTKSLLLVSKLTQDNPVDVVFSDPMFLIQNRHSKETLEKRRRRNGRYVLDQGNQAFFTKLSSTRTTASFDLWHNRLAPLVATSTHPPVVTSTDQPTPSPSVASQGSGHPMVTRSRNGIFKTRHFADLSHVTKSSLHHSLFSSKEPMGFKSAAKDPKWFAAMCDEMKALKLNATWDLLTNGLFTNWTNFTSQGTPFHVPTLYRFLVRAFQYLTITRPDLSYAVNQVSQFLHASMQDHFQAVKQIMRYVKGTLSYGLSFSHATAPTVLGYSDADWA
nr:hypothetical protein [Tanacetum cinerariifolium]